MHLTLSFDLIRPSQHFHIPKLKQIRPLLQCNAAEEERMIAEKSFTLDTPQTTTEGTSTNVWTSRRRRLFHMFWSLNFRVSDNFTEQKSGIRALDEMLLKVWTSCCNSSVSVYTGCYWKDIWERKHSFLVRLRRWSSTLLNNRWWG